MDVELIDPVLAVWAIANDNMPSIHRIFLAAVLLNVLNKPITPDTCEEFIIEIRYLFGGVSLEQCREIWNRMKAQYEN